MDDLNYHDQQLLSAYPTVLDASDNLAAELMSSAPQEVVNKYGEKSLYKSIFIGDPVYNDKVIDSLSRRRHSLILQFWPRSARQVNLNTTQKISILNFLSQQNENPDISKVEDGLKNIDPQLILPSETNLNDLIKKAKQIQNAYLVANQIFIQTISKDYLLDTIHLYQLPIERLQQVSNEINAISDQLIEEYQKNASNTKTKINIDLKDRISLVFQQAGRTPAYIQSEMEKANLDTLFDIFIKLGIAAKAAHKLKQKGNLTDLNQAATGEIIAVLEAYVRL